MKKKTTPGVAPPMPDSRGTRPGAPLGRAGAETSLFRDNTDPQTRLRPSEPARPPPPRKYQAPHVAPGSMSPLLASSATPTAPSGGGMSAAGTSGGAAPHFMPSLPPPSPDSCPIPPSGGVSRSEEPGSPAAAGVAKSLIGRTSASKPAGRAAERSCLKSGPVAGGRRQRQYWGRVTRCGRPGGRGSRGRAPGRAVVQAGEGGGRRRRAPHRN